MKHPRLVFLTFLTLAVVLTFLKVPLASSQGVTIMAAKVSEPLPVHEPTAELWQQATAVNIPLSAQMTAKPTWPEARVKSVDVRTLYNDTQIAFLVEWDDETENDSMLRVQDFRDAVAIQFPLVEGQPFFCMGQPGGDVNIWHWKADWQADIIARQDMETAYPNMYVDNYTFADPSLGVGAGIADYEDVNYIAAMAAGNLFALPEYSSPVEDLIAGTFGSLTSQPQEGQNVQGYGIWNNGRWQVVFTRDLTSLEAEDVQFALNQVYSIAFAAWDGENEERNGQKSTSQWVSLQLGDAPTSSGASASSAAAPAPSASGGSRANALEGLPYIFIPMGAIVVLLLGMAVVVFVISKLPDRR